MPLELVAVGPKKAELKEYQEKSPEKNEIKIRSKITSEKHGTGLLIYRGLSSINEKFFDEKTGLFLSTDFNKKGNVKFPFPLGNMTVGIVEEIGKDVRNFKVGDRVYGYLPIREVHTVPENSVYLAPKDLSDEELVCIDPALVALMSVREGHVRLGDTVAIFGMGAIGLMTVQMAKLSGALLIIAVEPLEMRADLAKKYGADIIINPLKQKDPGLEIRRLTQMKGVDISIETSGCYTALHHAIRATRFGGTIVPAGWYHGSASELNLGEEWHFNRHIMVSGARVESVPYRDYPLWDPERVRETVISLFQKKILSIEGMLNPVVPINQSPEAYRLIDEQPEKCIKLAITYPEK